MSGTLEAVREGLLATEPGEFVVDAVVPLRATRCAPCSLVAFPARETCEGCGGAVEPIALSTRATLCAHTEVIHPPPDSKVPVPYGVGLARFPEGIAILGLLDDELRQTAEIGTEVETYLFEPYPGHATYAFRRV